MDAQCLSTVILARYFLLVTSLAKISQTVKTFHNKIFPTFINNEFFDCKVDLEEEASDFLRFEIINT
ncbi:hypothetical protein DERP_003216 [Dermatophagoides pteronyssinus]|uniref:Uncharacterized protein n=1 Tax=Dermatophagoides pteronyssinus TaxID=6956 RepID=A0ABQ8JIV2_DERPT|nr:hypothetical protein DERP_003216 [Dermatophagoides pteronyssinus]